MPKEILERMVAGYGESAASYYKGKFWSKQFKWGRESIEDGPHTGLPVEATSEEMCQKLESLILADRRMKVSSSKMNTNKMTLMDYPLFHG